MMISMASSGYIQVTFDGMSAQSCFMANQEISVALSYRDKVLMWVLEGFLLLGIAELWDLRYCDRTLQHSCICVPVARLDAAQPNRILHLLQSIKYRGTMNEGHQTHRSGLWLASQRCKGFNEQHIRRGEHRRQCVVFMYSMYPVYQSLLKTSLSQTPSQVLQ